MFQPEPPHRARRPRAVLSVFLASMLLIGAHAWAHPAMRARAATPSAIVGLRVSGSTIVNGMGQPLRLLGVNRSGTEYQCIHNNGIFDGPSDAASVGAIASWHTNAVRVPLNEDCWLGINGAPAAYAGAAYQQAIVTYVNLLNSYGLAAILDLHWNAAGAGQATGQQQMPDADHAPAFWSSVAGVFKGNSSVIFDLYNEPHDVSWACWRDGGSCSGVGYGVAGMQSLVTAVRNTGATNVIMLGGLAYANDLSRWLAYEPVDPTNNLAAAWHVYNFNSCNNTGCYDSQVAPVAARVPLVTGEMGENDCAHGFIDATMAWLDAHNGNYLGWAWNTFDCGGFPALIVDYSGTPTAFGIGLRDHLAALTASTPTPTATSPAVASRTPAATPTAPASTATATSIPTSRPPTATSPAVTTATATVRPPATPTPPPALTSTPVPVSSATATAPPLPSATPVPATPTATVSPSPGASVTVAAGVAANSSPWWGEEDVRIGNTTPLTALRITVTVRKTPGVGYSSQYNSFPGGALTMGHTDTGDTVVYTYTLVPGQAVLPESGYIAGSQYSGTGTAHPTGGDTYAVSATAGGVTTTTTGHF